MVTLFKMARAESDIFTSMPIPYCSISNAVYYGDNKI